MNNETFGSSTTIQYRNLTYKELFLEVDDCANTLVKIIGCNKSDALKIMFEIYGASTGNDFSKLINLIPEWCPNE